MATTNRQIYPIYSLKEFSSITDLSSTFMELVVDDYGNNSYSNKKASFKTFGEYLVSSHPIFNKIDEIYNDKTQISVNTQTNEIAYIHKNDVYLSGTTHFLDNPKASNNAAFSNLYSNQTVQRKQLENFVHINGLEVEALTSGLKCNQCVVRGEWKEKEIKYSDRSIEPIYYPATKCKIKVPLFNNTLYGTNVIRMPKKGTFVTVVGKVKLPTDINKDTTPYYTPEKNLWAGVLFLNNLIAITEIHNFRNNLGYFSMQFPTANINFKVDNPNEGGPQIVNSYQRIRVVVPFKPDEIIPNDEDIQSESDIFRNIPINTVSLFYYAE